MAIHKALWNIQFQLLPGIELIQILEQNQGQYDLICMDGFMPLLDGFDTTRTIKTSYSNIPILAMINPENTINDSELAVFDGVLTKPILKNTLYKVIDTIFNQV